jgi:hypothetical protein
MADIYIKASAELFSEHIAASFVFNLVRRPDEGSGDRCTHSGGG